jgi:hypothetical protein
VPSTGWTPRIVPYGADQTVYLVVDRFGPFGSVYRETEVERTDIETIIADLCQGNSTTRFASWHSTRWSIGQRTSRNRSLTKFKPAATLMVLRSLNM